MATDKITLFAQKLEGRRFFEYEKPPDFVAFWLQAPPGRYVVEIKRARPPKSQKQLGAIFGLMIKQAVEQADDKGIGFEELIKYLLTVGIPKGCSINKDCLLQLAYIICPTMNDEGMKITLSKMNTKQAAEFFDRFRNILAPLGIVIPDPNPDWRK